MFILSFDPDAFDPLMAADGSVVVSVSAPSVPAVLLAGAAALDSAYAGWLSSGDVAPARLAVTADGAVVDLSNCFDPGDGVVAPALIGSLSWAGGVG